MICLLPLYALLTVTAGQGVGTPVHTVILDVANSTTTLKIFQETVVHSRYGPDATVKLIYSKQFYPGVRKALREPGVLHRNLDTILTEAKNKIVSAYYEWTTLYVMATSELRFVPVMEMEEILGLFRYILGNNQTLNPFKFQPSNVQLLTGEDEAAYTWLSANYLLGAFGRNRYQNETVGVLDMGNGSTQISFVPDEPLYSEKYPIVFRNKKHELYTQNYLQYGAESILVKIHNILTNGSKDTPELILNPCLLRENIKKVELSDGTIVLHKGTADPDVCESIMIEIVSPSRGDFCWPKPCAIGSVYQAHVRDVQFLATVGFAYTPTALGVVDETKVLYLDRLRMAGRRYCMMGMSQAMKDYERDEDNVSQDCVMGLYIPVLFTTAYGFSMDTRQIRLYPDHEGEPIDWSHGFVVYMRDL